MDGAPDTFCGLFLYVVKIQNEIKNRKGQKKAEITIYNKNTGRGDREGISDAVPYL